MRKIVISEYLIIEDNYYGGSEAVPYSDLLDDKGMYLECTDEEVEYWMGFVNWYNKFRLGSWRSEKKPYLQLVEIHSDPKVTFYDVLDEWEEEKRKEEEKKKKNQERAKKAQKTKRRNKIMKLSEELGISESEVGEMLDKKEHEKMVEKIE